MIQLRHFLIAGLGVSNALLNHEEPEIASLPDCAGKSYVKISFAGTARLYADLGNCTVSSVGATDYWYTRANAENQGFLSIAVCGSSNEGVYAFGNNQTLHASASLLTYSFGQLVYSSYHNDDYCLTEGTVLLEHYDTQTQARGSFRGVLVLRSKTPSPANVTPITGEFYLSIA